MICPADLGGGPAGDVWQRLAMSRAVARQQVAFTYATGVPLTLLPTGKAAKLAADAAGGPFSVQGCLGGDSGQICSRLLQSAEKLAARRRKPVRFRCLCGLVKILVPVTVRGRHIGSLLAGPLVPEKLEGRTSRRLEERLARWGFGSRANRLRQVWQHARLVTADECQALKDLLCLVAENLAQRADSALTERDFDSPLLRKIEAALASNPAVSMRQVAKHVALSPCHFCRVFRQQTRMTFTEYRLAHQIERARKLLSDPHRRVSEAAFEAGFESLPYFSRVFHRYVGCSPTEYRQQIQRANRG